MTDRIIEQVRAFGPPTDDRTLILVGIKEGLADEAVRR